MYKSYLAGAGFELTHELVVAIVCERMGWTYWDFEAAPVWLVDTLLMKWTAEARHAKEQEKG